ncbi:MULTISPECIES: sensor histidine kinase [Aliiglaciecola]|uniref:sensor histidine kinase n=1 Tax=Aliiglaciecola TaxID=1406885 RepID=UPI001C084F6D|nr:MULTISPECIES: ATP-binding protein [Aliiglaciecola]MBU2877571.1 GHKL domain-containing protein [Aliiglaciecola lipolytica]MDO6711151.1 ATP-binding protein [Aliiglaciecola sp. 2_MG-2023]MDO6752065.1 ATP-binding protein [Aliiglaciecola sp. 1_MG-2023]
MDSIRKYLTLLLISAIALISFIAALQGYRSGMQMSSVLFDAELKTLAQSITNLPNQINDTIPASNEDLAIQSWSANNLVLRTSNVPLTPIAPFEIGYSDQNFNAQRWRVYASFNQQTFTWVFVAQPLKTRFELTEEMMISAMTPFFVAIPVLALAIFLLVTYGLAPLRELTSQLSTRRENDFSAIELSRTPEELLPTVNTLNSLLTRLNSAFEREKQFASHAAHELRTPLSVLKINLHNLQQSQCSDYEDIKHLQQDTDRMIHVVNQILLLSRTNPEIISANFDTFDPYKIAQKVISDIYVNIDKKNQNIELNGESCEFRGNEFALYTLLQNLISNANKYTPENSDIRINLSLDDKCLHINVDDSGAGIPEHEQAKSTLRFYRGQNHQKSKIEGSGLGLSIVEQIVAMHNGKLTLGKSDLGGLSVLVELYSA